MTNFLKTALAMTIRLDHDLEVVFTEVDDENSTSPSGAFREARAEYIIVEVLARHEDSIRLLGSTKITKREISRLGNVMGGH